MSVTRGWCGLHYKRWQLWKDPHAPTRKAAALALSVVLVACSPVRQECEAPAGMVLVPQTTADQFARDINDLDDTLAACTKDNRYWKARNDCS